MKRLTASFPQVVIRASAGTGKTFRLAHRFLGLLFAGAQPEEVLAVTFARKAAGEIIDRVLLRLAEAIDDPTKLADLAKHVGQPVTRRQCQDLLRQLLARLHRLRIGTLDSFFIQLAGHFSFEFHLPLGWKIVEEVEAAQLRDEAIHAVLGESLSEITTLVGLLFKGETQRSVTNQIRDLVSALYDLYLQTESEAWQRLPHGKGVEPERLHELIEPLTLLKFDDSRFTKFQARDIEHAQRGDWLEFITDGLAKHILAGATTYYKKPFGDEALQTYEPLLNEARIRLTNLLAQQTEATYRLLDKYDRAIRQLKYQQRALRFDDVTRELASRLSGADVTNLAFRLDTQLSHLLLDEFQDTSLAQWNVIRAFAEPAVKSSGDRSFFCVGDVKQAIYGWRGGVSEIFDCLQEQLTGLTEDALTTSFRSCPVVIETVNRIFTNLAGNPTLSEQREVARAWQGRFATHSTARNELAGYSRLIVAPEAGEDEKPRDVLLAFAAEEIARLSREHPERTVGVLVQRNATVAALMHLLRSRHQLQASEEGGNPLSDSRAVQLAMSALKLADHPRDTIARYHVAHSPLGELLGLVDHRDHAAAERVSHALRNQLLHNGYGQTLFRWLAAIAPLCDAREFKRFEQLIDLAYVYDRQATLRPTDFITHIESQRVEDPTAAKVRVMTVHQAKGLQFDIVVLPELDGQIKGPTPQVVIDQPRAIDPVQAVCRYAKAEIQQLLPASFVEMFERRSRPKVSESLCVLYVAITRAIHELHLIVAPAKEEPGKLKHQEKSPTFAAILRAALAPETPRTPGKVLFEAGTTHWDNAPLSSPHVPDLMAEETRPLTIRLRPPSATRGWERQSPSQLQGGQEIDLAQRWSSDHSGARLRGSLLHAWFEQVEWLTPDGGEPTDEALERVARRHGGLSLDPVSLREHFRHLLRQPHTRGALSQAAYAPDITHGKARTLDVFCERGFAVRDEGALLQGAIDRLVIVREGERVVAAEVIDFKTDQVRTAAQVREKRDYYAPQLAAYRRAVGQIYGLEPAQVRAKLLFVESDQVIEVN